MCTDRVFAWDNEFTQKMLVYAKSFLEVKNYFEQHLIRFWEFNARTRKNTKNVPATVNTESFVKVWRKRLDF